MITATGMVLARKKTKAVMTSSGKRARSEHALQIVIGEVRQHDRIGHHAEDVEQDFERNEFLPCSKQALRQGCGAAEYQRLGKVQFEHAQQDEQKVHRHGAVEAGQLNFQAGRENGDQEVADKSGQVDASASAKGRTPSPPYRGRPWLQ